MFKKKPTFKSLAPLRSSDRRKVIDQIIQKFGLSPPEPAGQGQGQGQGNASASGGNSGDSSSALSQFRSSILPEGALSANFTTTVGPDLKTAKGVIYVGAHAGDSQRILWVKLSEGDLLIPTVYTLWRLPRIVPLLHTPNLVVQKMREGADLNTPGLAGGPPFPAQAKKGAVVAVASLERPSVPVVVGQCEIDVSALGDVRGQKGHAVEGLHWEGDELWSWGPGSGSGSAGNGAPAPDKLDAWLAASASSLSSSSSPLSEQEESMKNLTLNADDSAKASSNAATNDKTTSTSDQDQDSTTVAAASTSSSLPRKEWTTADIDGAFRGAFLYALHKARSQNTTDPNHGISFPLSQSQFVATLISPYLPIFDADDGAALQIKKTSWKTVKKFIKTLDKQLLLKSKDRNGGETVVLDVDFNDEAVNTFTPYRLPRKDTTASQEKSSSATSGPSASQADPSVGQQLQRLSLYRPKEKLSPLFGASVKGKLYLPQEIKSKVVAYAEEEALINPTNKRLVKLNPLLANAVFDSGSSADNEALAKGSVPRELLVDRVVASCSPFWLITRKSDDREDAKAKSGHVPAPRITLETRTGNKTATKISGLEPYFVNVTTLAEELQKACASSTTVGQVTGSSPKDPKMEVMVQGPQKDAILKALENRGIRKEWVEIVDKTKSKKK